ncbi:MAG TPA: hypothetical protein VM008_19170 [Phycisphaerae bacterium]|nr:hypothetical protein [Phycisphaerae bacterium]
MGAAPERFGLCVIYARFATTQALADVHLFREGWVLRRAQIGPAPTESAGFGVGGLRWVGRNGLRAIIGGTPMPRWGGGD